MLSASLACVCRDISPRVISAKQTQGSEEWLLALSSPSRKERKAVVGVAKYSAKKKKFSMREVDVDVS